MHFVRVTRLVLVPKFRACLKMAHSHRRIARLSNEVRLGTYPAEQDTRAALNGSLENEMSELPLMFVTLVLALAAVMGCMALLNWCVEKSPFEVRRS